MNELNEIFELASKLTALSAVSGREQHCFDKLKEITSPLFDEFKTTPTGSFIGTVRCKKENAPLLLLDAHIDEIGFVVSEICEGGFLRTDAAGGIDTRVLSATEVTVFGKKDIRGVFTSKPPHLREPGELTKKIKLSEMYVDTGYTKEELEEIVQIGDTVGFFSPAVRLQNDMIASKSLDDRICATAILKAIKDIDREKLNCDIAVLLSGGEEVGYIGSQTAAFELKPDLAIALDVTTAYMPGGPDRIKETRPGDGAVIYYSATTDRKLTDSLIKTAEEFSVRHIVRSEAGETGTNAHMIQISAGGIPCALISVPLRYMHTCAEVISLRDVKDSADLLRAFAENLPDRFKVKEEAWF